VGVEWRKEAQTTDEEQVLPTDGYRPETIVSLLMSTFIFQRMTVDMYIELIIQKTDGGQKYTKIILRNKPII